ncbi:MAG: efflux RND transporter permease subunit [Candidatus Sumerlaeota bacterium]|nr:efflux RND transporter permease subunit [Candidatus Sumerlaeota bacterium]
MSVGLKHRAIRQTPGLFAANASPQQITEYCDKVLRRQLESIEGVGQAMLVGGQLRQINVNLDPIKLRAHDLTISNVARALTTQNLQIPGGTIKQGAAEYTLCTMGRVTAVKELENIAAATRGDHTITIGDLGAVEDGVEEAYSFSQYNETPCLLLNIRRQSGANTVEVVDRVKERLKEIIPNRPKGYDIKIVRDNSVFIKDSVRTVEEHLLWGAGFAAIVVLVFLFNVRTTFISALAIPTSIISAFAVMNFMGFTLNGITLLALTLSVGIVIDDAIVVLENIYRYIDEKDYKPYDAAIAATKEIGMAVLSITLSLVAIFLPIAVMSGIVGRFLKSFGITMAAAIIVSMLVSFTLTPMLAARWLKRPKHKNNRGAKGNGIDGKNGNNEADKVGEARAEGAAGHLVPEEPHSMNEFQQAHSHSASKGQFFYHIIESAYLALLKAALRWRWVVVLICVGLLASIYPLMKKQRVNFLPEDDQSEFQVNVRAPEGTTLEATRVILARIARDLRALDGVEYTMVSVADSDQRTANLGSAYVRLVDPEKRNFDQQAIIQWVRKELLPRYADQQLRMSVTPVSLFSGGGMANTDIAFMIAGPDMKKLEDYAGRLMEKLRAMPDAVDVDSTLVTGKPQYGVTVDRAKAANLGVAIADIAQTLRLLVAGDKASTYFEKGEEYEVHVRANALQRNRIEDLKMVTVPSSKIDVVPLGDVARFDPGTGPAQINRLSRARQVTVTANLKPGSSQKAVLDALAEETKTLDMGPDCKSGLIGRSKEMARMLHGFMIVFLLAFIFVYLVLAAQFESWLHPITILLALPLTLPFALVSLLFFGQSLNIFSILGVLVLFAVVKKNSILQIDHTNQLREAGMPRTEAILAANLDRLRPILMTTVAFVAGMIPLLLFGGAGAATNKTISSVVIGGQTLSLLLTLIAIPVTYSLFDDLAHWRPLRRMFKKKE